MRLFVWLFRAAVFFTLFAFALNNREPSKISLFFGYEWQAPMVFIVLAVFGIGVAFGIVAMVPSWWRHRRLARSHRRRADDSVAAPGTTAATNALPVHPPRDGL